MIKKSKRVKQPLEMDLEVARKLKLLRKEKQVCQKPLAEKVGVTFQQYQKYESGKNRLTLGRLCIICQALEVKLSYFIE